MMRDTGTCVLENDSLPYRKQMSTHIHIRIYIHGAKVEGDSPTFQFTKGKEFATLNPESEEDADVHYQPRGPKGRSEKPATWR